MDDGQMQLHPYIRSRSEERRRNRVRAYRQAEVRDDQLDIAREVGDLQAELAD